MLTFGNRSVIITKLSERASALDEAVMHLEN